MYVYVCVCVCVEGCMVSKLVEEEGEERCSNLIWHVGDCIRALDVMQYPSPASFRYEFPA